MTIQTPMVKRWSFLLSSSAAVAASLWFGASSAQAQYGVSPSQTGMFFDDFRARQSMGKSSSASGTRNADVVYDYDKGMYVGTEEAPMGVRDGAYEAARQISRPTVTSGSAAYSARSVADYTNYSGQYTSPTSFFAPTYASDPFLDGRRNVRLGKVNIGFGLYQGLEYNDNINRANDNAAVGPISDVISTTLLNIDANYQITQNNRLTLSTGIGFDHYFEHPEVAPYGTGDFVLNVLPGSSLAFDIKAGPVFITIYDRVSVRPAVRNDFALTSNQVFGVFQNDAGIAANWRINSAWTLGINYMHSTSDALQNQFEQFSRTTDSLHASLTFSPNGSWMAGLEGGSTWLNYKQPFNNDGVLTNFGAFVLVPVGKSTSIRVSGGVQNFEFDDPDSRFGPPLISGDTTDLENEFYYTVAISNQINARVSQSLTFGRESALNTISNFVTSDYINYGVAIIAWKGSRISLSGYYEDATMSGGAFAEDLSQYGFDVHVSHRLTSKMQVGVGYHFGRTDSDVVGTNVLPVGTVNTERGYDQHAFNVDVNYALSAKASLFFGYRYYTTNADNGLNSFNQNRFIMALNYNF